jgi:hypothetical protein
MALSGLFRVGTATACPCQYRADYNQCRAVLTQAGLRTFEAGLRGFRAGLRGGKAALWAFLWPESLKLALGYAAAPSRAEASLQMSKNRSFPKLPDANFQGVFTNTRKLAFSAPWGPSPAWCPKLRKNSFSMLPESIFLAGPTRNPKYVFV